MTVLDPTPNALPGDKTAAVRAGLPPDPQAGRIAHRGKLFRKYLLLILSLVSIALLVSSGTGLYFSYQEIRSTLGNLQHEKAIGAASRIEQYVRQTSQQLGYAALPQLDAGDVESHRIEFLKLLRQAPEVTDIAQLDASGREQLAVSRLGMDVVASNRDRSRDPAFVNAKRGQPWYGPVYFRKETEPYMTVAIRAGSESGPVTVAEVNLKFIWDVVSRIKIGARGKAYVVDAAGFLVADPDIGLVLRKTSVAALPHVKAAAQIHGADEPAMVSKDLAGTSVLTSVAPIESLGWNVFVEQPIAEVYARLDAAILRTAALLLAGLVISALAASALARGMVRPIRTLDEGARRIGAGELDQTIVVKTGDELEGLADQFNRMTARLRESYAGLEQKVEARTLELSEALEQQTATAGILQVISGSVADTQPVFDAILASCERLFGGQHMGINLVGADGLVHLAAHRGPTPDREAFEGTFPVPLTRESGSGSAILDRRVMHYPDTEAASVPAYVQRSSRAVMTRSVIIAPLLWEGHGIGAIFVGRGTAGPFSEKDIALLRTFADQAVIAIQNARLFNETKDALEQQTATSEVLKTISRTTFDLQPVLATLIESASRLCHADKGLVYLRDGEAYAMKVSYRVEPGNIDTRPLSAEPGTLVGRVALLREIVHIEDALNDPTYTWKAAQERLGYRTMLGVPMLREGQPVGVVAMWRDEVRPFSERDIRVVTTFADQAVIALENVRLLSEIQAKSRELEAANRHKSEFLANMSHELRTPLNAIIGFSEVLSEQMFGEVNPKQLEYLQDIHSSGQHLLTLINDVLDLSKIEAGRMELDLSCFDLGLLLDNSLTLVRERAQRHGLSVVLEVGHGLEEWVADARKVKQVVVNLLSNAVKFTPTGGSVTLQARRIDAGDQATAEISVADTGVGIAPEEQALVFEEFRQASGDYLRKTEGTGLGLSLARRFVELHGGSIRIDSRPGAGSTFTVTLPLQVLEAIS